MKRTCKFHIERPQLESTQKDNSQMGKNIRSNSYSAGILDPVVPQEKVMMKKRKMQTLVTHGSRGKCMYLPWGAQCDEVFSVHDEPQFETQSQGQCSRRYNLSQRFSYSSAYSLSLLPFYFYTFSSASSALSSPFPSRPLSLIGTLIYCMNTHFYCLQNHLQWLTTFKITLHWEKNSF